MRRDPTWAEFRLWQALRGDALGVRFRRQHPIGNYIVDFVCLTRKVIVEANGESHDEDDPRYVARRERYLRRRGFAVLVLSDHMINHDLDQALGAIREVLENHDAQWEYGIRD